MISSVPSDVVTAIVSHTMQFPDESSSLEQESANEQIRINKIFFICVNLYFQFTIIILIQ